jgi:ADP-heptose:LPS heptosyltransferase/glycosyltransferase involved in cell wall biosynthesis
MKILLFSDSPFLPTGQGRVMLELGRRLKAKGHQVESLAWSLGNAKEHVYQKEWPITFIGTCYSIDVGRTIEIIGNIAPDVCLMLGDLHHFDGIQCVRDELLTRGKPVYFHLYLNVDGEGLPAKHRATICGVDSITCTSNFASKQVELNSGKKFPFVWHGVDSNIFKPIKSVEDYPCSITDVFGATTKGNWKDYFVVTYVGRNSIRKSLHLLIQALTKIDKECPRLRALFVTNPRDRMGFQLNDLATVMGYNPEKLGYIISTVDNPITDEQLNAVYNHSTVTILTSIGEGQGFLTLESFAAGVPTIGSDNSATSELIKAGGGVLIPSERETWACEGTKHRKSTPDAISSALLNLYKDWEIGGKNLDKMRLDGVNFSKKNSWDYCFSKLYDHITNNFISYKKTHEKIDTCEEKNLSIGPSKVGIDTGMQHAICNVTKKFIDKEQVYIVKMGGIGDIIQATPIFKGVSKRHPGANIILLTEKEENSEILLNNPYLTEIIVFGNADQRSLVKSIIPLCDYVYDLRYVSYIYGKQIDLAKGKKWFYEGWPWSNPRLPSLNKNVVDLMIESCGMKGIVSKDDLYVHCSKTKVVDDLPKYVVVHNGVGNVGNLKQYDTNGFQNIIRWLNKSGYKTVQAGIGSEPLLSEEVIDFRGKLSMPEIAYLYKQAVAYIGVEGGMFHLAKAVGTPGAVWFSVTPPECFAYDNTLVLYNNKCLPCWWRGNGWHTTCVLDKETCVNLPSADEIISKLGNWEVLNLNKKEKEIGYISLGGYKECQDVTKTIQI